jgi:D-alanyl-D-alanine carboxypeptidase
VVRVWSWGVTVAAVGLAAGAGWYLTAVDELSVVEAAATGTGRVATSTTTSTTTSPDPPQTTTRSEAPDCTVDDQPAEGDPASDWASIVVDATFTLPADFVPPDLVEVSAAGFDTGDRVRQFVVADLDALRRAAEAAGHPLTLVSAYRSHSYQTGLFEQEVDRQGLDQAQLTTARPGHSEHQLGTAVDVTDADESPLDASFAATPTAGWLSDHAHEHGFVVSYPDVPPERSCYQHEPWHLRYVGRDLAQQVHASGLTLREWLLAR